MKTSFFGRSKELGELNTILREGGAQHILVYGRRRVGKTTLLINWAKQTDLPMIYWVATRDTPAQLRHSFMQALWSWAHPDSQAAPRFDSWREVFETAASLVGDQRIILIMDEFSYAAESDPGLSSNLQAAWDHALKDSNIILVVMGSHIGVMENLKNYEAPLYGRFTAQLPVEPLPFIALRDFLPHYEMAELVAAYAIVGGIPGYLERFDGRQNIGENIKRLFVRRTGMFRSEPFLLVGDVLRREAQTHEAILKAIASGARTPQEIGGKLEQPSTYLSPYLKQLEDIRLVDRRIPALLAPDKRATSKKSRYHLADPYLRFYFRFIAPNLNLIEQELPDLLWERIAEQFRAFVGMTAFEDLACEWVLAQARAGELGFLPEVVGSHWTQEAQIDVAAINWRDRSVLIGECKWGTDPVRRPVVRTLVEKAQKVMPEGEWALQYAFFSRAGYTEAAQEEAAKVGAKLIGLEELVTE
ncbi:MAG: ATP-binding protein [Chloroflexi bacterium]|nr:MAG: ATP-binding protein [Chloroflexota bacterium]